MAVVKHAQVQDVTTIGSETCLVDLQMAEPLGHVGGQYIIIDSGLVLPSGKAAKRAYSLLTPDVEQTRFQLAVKRIPGGLCSGFLHGLEKGAPLRFSGPWGKFRAPNAAGGASGGRCLLLCTDTGVTAALGLVQSAGFCAALSQTLFVWLHTGDFVSERFVRARVPTACREVRCGSIPPVHHPERLDAVRACVGDVLRPGVLTQAFLSGDGLVNAGLGDDLRQLGVVVGNEQVESFFNMPKKSDQRTPAAATAGAMASTGSLS